MTALIRHLAIAALLVLTLSAHALADEVLVAAASDLNFPIKEIIAAFEQATGHTVMPIPALLLVAAMRHFNVYDRVSSRLVIGENAAQAAQFVSSGAADIGIVPHSTALAEPMHSAGKFWEVPAEAYPRLDQGMAILKQARKSGHFQAAALSMSGSEMTPRVQFSRTTDFRCPNNSATSNRRSINEHQRKKQTQGKDK